MTEMFPVGNVEQKRSGICACGGEARPGQGYCLECHKAAQKRYLARKAAKHAADHRAHLALIKNRVVALIEGGKQMAAGRIRMFFRRHPEWMLWAWVAFCAGSMSWLCVSISRSCR